MSYDQLAAWCKKHKEIPEDDNDPFVSAFQINIDDDDPDNFPADVMNVPNPKGLNEFKYFKI